MAVEARHLSLFPSQLAGNREIMNQIEGNLNIFHTQVGCAVPLSGITTAEALLPPAYSSMIAGVGDSNTVQHNTTLKSSDSGLTCNNNLPVLLSRKRTRDSITPLLSSYPSTPQPTTKNSSTFSFLGQDMSFLIQQQQQDIDRLIGQHMGKVRVEMEEKRKREARRIMEAIEVGMMKKLKAKDEEIEKMGKLNWALEEKVKSLCVQNQIWRDLAQSNEATANALRTNLETLLKEQQQQTHAGVVLEENTAITEDAQSCCGSNGGGCEEEEEVGMGIVRGGRMLARCAGEGKEGVRVCRNCRKGEACVLILPCRHLCLCTVCGSTLHTCPICKSIKNASVHVNLS